MRSIVPNTNLVTLFYIKGLKLADDETEVPLNQNASQSEIDRHFSKSLGDALNSMMIHARENQYEKIYADLDEFRAFVHFAMSTVITKGTWRLNRARNVVSSIFTIYDEALALALLDNSCEAWHTLHNVPAQDTDTVPQQHVTKYTCYKIKIGNREGLKRGWSVQGVTKYNEFVTMVRAKRQGREEMEAKTCTSYKNMMNGNEDGDNTSSITGSEEDETVIRNVQAECGLSF